MQRQNKWDPCKNRKACPSADAISEIRRLSGIQSDPKVVIAFEQVMAQNNFPIKKTHPVA